MLCSDLTEKTFVEGLKTLQPDEGLKKIKRHFKTNKNQLNDDDKYIGVTMGQVLI